MLHSSHKAASLALSRFPTLTWPLRRFCDFGRGGIGKDGSDDDGTRRFWRFCDDVREGDGEDHQGESESSNLGDDDVRRRPRLSRFCEERVQYGGENSSRRSSLEGARLEAERVFELVQQDGLGFDFREELEAMDFKLSAFLVREVLIRILKSINCANRYRYARLAYKFFMWAGQQEGYRHTSNSYNLILKIFSECKELRVMWELVCSMNQDGVPVTARTFNILLCTCGEAGLRRRLVVSFLQSTSFNYRPFKHSYDAILHGLVAIDQWRLVEWVYQQMKLDGHEPGILTYNILLRAKYMLRKLDEFHRLLGEMGEVGITPDLHTYNLLLHVLGRGDKPLAARNLLDYMDGVGCTPSVMHYTSLIDGLSRAGDLDAAKYFFEEMSKKGCNADVVCYTVMITGYVISGELEMAQGMFEEMMKKGQLPNVYTYNSMIRGLCDRESFSEACSMLKDMEARGCTPNFLVYSRLVRRLRNAKKFQEALNVINDMIEKGRYAHLIPRFKGYRRL